MSAKLVAGAFLRAQGWRRQGAQASHCVPGIWSALSGLDMTPNEVRKQFRTELQFALGPIYETSRANYEGALKFADAAIKAVFALNGGGLIAFPAFIALFKIDAQLHARSIIAAGAIFVLGLICGALTTLFGYLSAMTAVESHRHLVDATTAKYAAIFQQPPSKIDAATADKLAK
jgi:hypothetical protein